MLNKNTIMKNTTVKDKILKAIQEMPSDVTFDEVMEQIYFLSKVERGLKQVEAGDTISHEEVKQRHSKEIQENQKISNFFRESP